MTQETTAAERAAEAAYAALISGGAALKVNAGGALVSLSGWLTSNQVLALAGLLVAIGGFLLQLVLGIRRDRREQEEHDQIMHPPER